MAVHVSKLAEAEGASEDPPPARNQDPNEPDRVQAVLEHEEGWRRVCGDDGRRLCCGAVVSFWAEQEDDDPARSMPSLLVRDGVVFSSPHDNMTASGGVKQHALVERAAAAAAAGTAHSTAKQVGDGDGAKPEARVLPICRTWWKSIVDGKSCVCAGEVRAEAEMPHMGLHGVCGRRHFFIDHHERAKWEQRACARAGANKRLGVEARHNLCAAPAYTACRGRPHRSKRRP